MPLYKIFRLLEWILLKLPLPAQRGFFRFLATLARLLSGKHRRIIRANLAFAFGDTLDEEAIRRIERTCFENLLLNFYQVMRNRRIGAAQIEASVRFENRETVDRVLAEGRPVIFTTGHFGRWELAGVAVSSMIRPTMVVYKRMKNPYFDAYVLESRQRHGMVCVEQKGAIKRLVKHLRSGGCVSMLTDVNLRIKDGIVADFMNHPTRQTDSPAYLAKKYGALIIPGFMFSEGDERFVYRFDDPIEVADSGDEAQDLLDATRQQAQALERAIARQKELWFWCHRRWKTDYPELYADV